ncbi:hypothetical protein [Streptomyces sp. NPDC020362]|uniref:WD40 repeat domain-containing protein n=1 Tax=unclassified Streptomyces TaxID=2593676 RepID=UPI0033C82856
MVCLWDPATGELVQKLLCPQEDEGLPSGLTAVSLPDGGILLALCRNYDDHETVRLWDVATGAPVGGPITGPGLHPVPMADGTTLLSIGSGLWDPVSGRRTGDVGTNRVPAATTAVPLPDGPTLLVGEVAGGAVRLWDPSTGLPVAAPFESHRHVEHIAAIPSADDRTLLAVRNFDGSIRVWDAGSRQRVGELTGGPMAAVVPSGGHPVLAVARRGAIELWDPLTCQWVGSRLLERPITALAGVGSNLVVGCTDGLALVNISG